MYFAWPLCRCIHSDFQPDNRSHGDWLSMPLGHNDSVIVALCSGDSGVLTKNKGENMASFYEILVFALWNGVLRGDVFWLIIFTIFVESPCL